jgi:ankyrin repeat protein
MTTTSGYSLLILAALAGSLPICRKMVHRGVPVDMVAERGFRKGAVSALAAATFAGEIGVVKFLIQEAGADANMALDHPYGSTLAVAATYGRYEIVKLLVEEGKADVNSLLRGGFGSALNTAASVAHIKIVEYLVREAGTDVDMQTEHGTALQCAIRNGRYDIVQFLVQEGKANVNLASTLPFEKFASPLAAAIHYFYDDAKIMKFLIQAGADVNQKLRVGRFGSVLAVAAYRGDVEGAEVLLEAGAQPNLQLENGEFRTALQAARTASRHSIAGNRVNQEGRAKVVDLLLHHGAQE